MLRKSERPPIAIVDLELRCWSKRRTLLAAPTRAKFRLLLKPQMLEHWGSIGATASANTREGRICHFRGPPMKATGCWRSRIWR